MRSAAGFTTMICPPLSMRMMPSVADDRTAWASASLLRSAASSSSRLCRPSTPAILSDSPAGVKTGAARGSAERAEISGQGPDVGVGQLQRRHVRARPLHGRIAKPARQVLGLVLPPDRREIRADRRPELADHVAAV